MFVLRLYFSCQNDNWFIEFYTYCSFYDAIFWFCDIFSARTSFLFQISAYRCLSCFIQSSFLGQTFFHEEPQQKTQDTIFNQGTSKFYNRLHDNYLIKLNNYFHVKKNEIKSNIFYCSTYIVSETKLLKTKCDAIYK